MVDAVKKDEDGMLKSGMYKSISRTADGAGAIITLGDGSVMWSDYAHGFDSMPQKDPQALADALMKSGSVSASAISAIKKAAMASAAAACPVNASAPLTMSALDFNPPPSKPKAAAAPSGRSSDAATPPAGSPAAPAVGGDGAGPAGPDQTAARPSDAAYGLGRQLGGSGNLFPGGQGGAGQGVSGRDGSSGRGYAAADPAITRQANAEAAAGAASLRVSDDYTFVQLQRAARSPVVRQLEKAAARGAVSTDKGSPDAAPNAAPAGSRLFGR